MPKKPAVDRDCIFTVLCSTKEAIVKNGNIATPNQSIWTELSKELENKITAKALYTFVKLNRHNIWTALGFTHESDNETSGSSDDTGDFEPGSLSPRPKDCWTFDLEVPFQEWIEFMPETVQYKNKISKTQKREYTILKPGIWTHVINHHIWQEVKSPCTFTFKRAKVYPSATEKYIEIRGKCKECHGHIHIKCDREPEMNSPMMLKCFIKNTDDSLHTGCSKRPMSGNLRVQISKELCEGRMESHVWRASEATKLMDFGDPEPSHLPNLATLRKAKQERNALEQGDKDPILEDLEKADQTQWAGDQTQTDLRQWVTEICEESRSLAVANGDHDNMHFLPEIIPSIIWLASYLPLWTGVMIPHFRITNIIASSANVEAEFKNIKRGLFKHENLPIRVDRFIARHLSFIEGNMRICSAKQNSKEKKDEEDAAVATVIVKEANPLPTITCSVDLKPEMDASWSGKSDIVTNIHPTEEDPEDPVENWRGLALPPKKRKRNSYLSPCPEWLHADPSVRGKKLKVELMKNGNNQQPVKLRKSRISVLNTCAFDAFCQCLCCAFCDSVTVANFVCGEDSNNLLQLVKSISTKGLNAQAYIQRAELLNGIFKHVQLKSGALQIDAQCHISTIIEKSKTKHACVYFTKQCSSQHCSLSTQVTREIPFVCTSVAVLQASGIAHLQTAVEEGLNLPDRALCREGFSQLQSGRTSVD